MPDRPQVLPASWFPALSTLAGIATFSAMDAAMKGAALAAGVFTPLLLRNVCGAVISCPLWLANGSPRPSRQGLAVHCQRAVVTAIMAALFFYGLVRIPLAEGLAISFIAPVLALYIAALMLGERIRARAVKASVLGLLGVAVIAAGRFQLGGITRDTALGIAAILLSAVFYAFNLVLQRKQAQLARPIEIALFQSLLVALVLTPAAPWLLRPVGLATAGMIVLAAVLATLSLLLLAWGYARAEAQVLVPIEYSGFLWAALFGWLFFAEPLTPTTLAGAALVMAGCWMAVHRHRE
ncbi:DMT family transporter [Novosphingobium colocasiae]|uniref:EamA domain-containing protein n=1 Tax=Novosphingobium colocasiae TaxID=1256513 RepID=A0A918P9M0_9SPHN|nr:DMT family transporter [Novosphingobium colocasiae]GGY92428.1 hypothetical protein GCM10011614_04020 [Novosphingobium colocasiae]